MPQSPYPRDTFVYDANVPTGNPPRLVAGFMQLGQTTGEEFYFCLEFCFSQPQPRQYRLMKPDGSILPRDGNIVAVGFYYVVTPADPTAYITVTLAADVARPRNISGGSPATGSTSTFRERVRERDQDCKLSGARGGPNYVALEACHIIPRSHYTAWSNDNMIQHLTEDERDYDIDSVKMAFCCRQPCIECGIAGLCQ